MLVCKKQPPNFRNTLRDGMSKSLKLCTYKTHMHVLILLMVHRFKMIWNVQKDNFFRRWRAQDPRVADFDQAITQYIELSNKVQQVDTLTNVEFILLDCSPLKFSTIAHCDEWQNRFHNLLLDMASTKLNDICTSLAENAKR